MPGPGLDDEGLGRIRRLRRRLHPEIVGPVAGTCVRGELAAPGAKHLRGKFVARVIGLVGFGRRRRHDGIAGRESGRLDGRHAGARGAGNDFGIAVEDMRTLHAADITLAQLQI